MRTLFAGSVREWNELSSVFDACTRVKKCALVGTALSGEGEPSLPYEAGKAYEDAGAMLEDVSADTIFVGTVPSAKTLIINALRKGRNILILSPRALSPEEYKEVYDIYHEEEYPKRKRGCAFLTPFLSDSKLNTLKKMLTFNRLGRIERVAIAGESNETDRVERMISGIIFPAVFFLINTENSLSFRLRTVYSEWYAFSEGVPAHVAFKIEPENGIPITGFVNVNGEGKGTGMRVSLSCENAEAEWESEGDLIVEYGEGIREHYAYREEREKLTEKILKNFLDYALCRSYFLYFPLEDCYTAYQLLAGLMEGRKEMRVIEQDAFPKAYEKTTALLSKKSVTWYDEAYQFSYMGCECEPPF